MRAIMSQVSLQQVGIAADRRSQELGGRRERTRQRVLDAAFRLIGRERGLSVRIEEICALAQISRGTFYNYFASLDELFSALSFELSHEFNLSVQATLARMSDGAERTNAAMRYYLERARRDPQWGWAMVNISAHGPLFGAETYESALRTVEEGIERGEFDLEDARFGRDMILGTCLAAMITQLREGSPESQPVMVSRHILRSLGVREARVAEIVAKPLPPPTQ
jgi:AcrR family transcriptional regulator